MNGIDIEQENSSKTILCKRKTKMNRMVYNIYAYSHATRSTDTAGIQIHNFFFRSFFFSFNIVTINAKNGEIESEGKMKIHSLD